jgi:hypothetical protein
MIDLGKDLPHTSPSLSIFKLDHLGYLRCAKSPRPFPSTPHCSACTPEVKPSLQLAARARQCVVTMSPSTRLRALRHVLSGLVSTMHTRLVPHQPPSRAIPAPTSSSVRRTGHRTWRDISSSAWQADTTAWRPRLLLQQPDRGYPPKVVSHVFRYSSTAPSGQWRGRGPCTARPALGPPYSGIVGIKLEPERLKPSHHSPPSCTLYLPSPILTPPHSPEDEALLCFFLGRRKNRVGARRPAARRGDEATAPLRPLSVPISLYPISLYISR